MRYEAPETLDAAVGLLQGEPGLARPLAGGTDLLVQLRAGIVEPDLVVDLKRIPEMRRITAENGGFRIGAAVTGAELGEPSNLLVVSFRCKVAGSSTARGLRAGSSTTILTRVR
jgi:carbon-monoxide dehydrogenase medium subunit